MIFLAARLPRGLGEGSITAGAGDEALGAGTGAAGTAVAETPDLELGWADRGAAGLAAGLAAAGAAIGLATGLAAALPAGLAVVLAAGLTGAFDVALPGDLTTGWGATLATALGPPLAGVTRLSAGWPLAGATGLALVIGGALGVALGFALDVDWTATLPTALAGDLLVGATRPAAAPEREAAEAGLPDVAVLVAGAFTAGLLSVPDMAGSRWWRLSLSGNCRAADRARGAGDSAVIP